MPGGETAMTWPLNFPDPQAEVRRRAEAFQRLPPDTRWNEIIALMAFGSATVKSSPHREAIERQMEAEERRWREIQSELFARHGR
jgi:hypothetical protein